MRRLAAANGADQTPAFPGQTRTPEQKSGVAFDVVIVADGLQNPWGQCDVPQLFIIFFHWVS